MDLDRTIKSTKEILNEFKDFLLYYIPQRYILSFINKFNDLERYIDNKKIITIDKYELIQKEISFQKKYLISYSGFYIKKYSHNDMEYNKIILHILSLPDYLLNLI